MVQGYVEDIIIENTTPVIFQLSEPTWITHRDFILKVNMISQRLRSLLKITGFNIPLKDGEIYENSSITIYENTCPEWLQVAIAAWTANIVVVSVFPSLCPQTAIDILETIKGRVIMCNQINVVGILEAHSISKNNKLYLGNLCHIIYNHWMIPRDQRIHVAGLSDNKARIHLFNRTYKYQNISKVSICTNVCIWELSELLSRESLYGPIIHNSPRNNINHNISREPLESKALESEAKAIALIMHTSGTSGASKGVVITHTALISSVSSMVALSSEDLARNITYLAYLPVSHIFELVVELSNIVLGMRIAYADPSRFL